MISDTIALQLTDSELLFLAVALQDYKINHAFAAKEADELRTKLKNIRLAHIEWRHAIARSRQTVKTKRPLKVKKHINVGKLLFGE